MNTFKKSVALTAPQHVWLKAEAERFGLTEADLIRRIIDQWRSRGEDARDANRKYDAFLAEMASVGLNAETREKIGREYRRLIAL